MKQNNWKFIQQLEFIDNCIKDECEGYLFYRPKSNSDIFDRIRNASNMLLNNALRMMRNQQPIIKSCPQALTLEQTKDLMFKIYKNIMAPEFPVIIENKIKKMMATEFLLNPDELLKNTPSIETEYVKNLAILNGKLW